MNIMESCVSFQIKVQILAIYLDVCTAPKGSSIKCTKNLTIVCSRMKQMLLKITEFPHIRVRIWPKSDFLNGRVDGALIYLEIKTPTCRRFIRNIVELHLPVQHFVNVSSWLFSVYMDFIFTL